MKYHFRSGIVFAIIIAIHLGLMTGCKKPVEEKYKPTWESLATHPAPAWYTNAKFGIFIHWGVYAVPAYHEWYLEFISPKSNWGQKPEGPPYTAEQGDLPDSVFYAGIRKNANEYHRKNYGVDFEYDDFIPMFKAEHYNPGEWADLFREAGARYVVFTAKHGDEFAMWPSKYNKRNAMRMGPHRDLAGELASAVRSRGMKMGFYHNTTYSFWDKRFPGTEWVKFMNNSVKELVDLYHPDILWGDVLFNTVKDVNGRPMIADECWNSKEVIAYYYNHSPDPDEVLTNDRWGLDTSATAIQSEKAFSKSIWAKHERNLTLKDAAVMGDIQTPERRNITGIFDLPWETCDALDPTSWGYNKQTTDDQYMSANQVVDYLSDIVSKGGNLLINIGPKADGTIPSVMQERLKEIGSWLKVNGEAIYGTRPWKVFGEGPTNEEIGVRVSKGKKVEFKPGDVRFTKKGNSLYIILLEWPGIEITLKSLQEAVVEDISLLGSEEKVRWEKTDQGLRITLPAFPVSPLANTLKAKLASR